MTKFDWSQTFNDERFGGAKSKSNSFFSHWTRRGRRSLEWCGVWPRVILGNDFWARQLRSIDSSSEKKSIYFLNVSFFCCFWFFFERLWMIWLPKNSEVQKLTELPKVRRSCEGRGRKKGWRKSGWEWLALKSIVPCFFFFPMLGFYGQFPGFLPCISAYV